MNFSSLWRYIRQFFSTKQDRVDADLIHDYYRQLQETTESEDDYAVPVFRQQELYECIRKAMERQPQIERVRWCTVQLAASVMVAMSAAIWYWNAVQETTSVALMKTEYNALQGVVKKLTLPDGTQVWLNSGSEISYFASNATGIRNVELKGEAYFDVVRDGKRPFKIDMEKISVTVLGTSFNVRSYGDEEEIEVFVTTGTVFVAPGAGKEGQDGVTLRPNRQVKYDKTNNRFTRIDSIDAHSKAIWTAGKMRYQATPLCIILADLERRFHINVNANHQLADCLITVDFDDAGPTEALEILAGVLAGDVENEQGIYKLKGIPCK